MSADAGGGRRSASGGATAAGCADGRAASLGLAVSPYHLCTREAPVMLAVALGGSVTTLMPEPPSGASREAVGDAVIGAPRYLRLLQSWKWSGPLWSAGVLKRGAGGHACGDLLAETYRELREEDRWASLRAVTGGPHRYEAGTLGALDALAGDMLRGGPDPGFNIPVTATLDRFASRHGLAVVRGTTASVAQRAELRMGARVAAFGIPVLLRAGGQRVLAMREDLREPLDRLRAAISQAAGQGEVGADRGADRGGADQVGACARAYGAAFEAWAATGAAGDDENGERVTTGYVGVQAMMLPADAALRSGVAAIRAMGASVDFGGGESGQERVLALFVRTMNARPTG